MATITATPQVVLFPSPHLGAWPQSTKIDWDAGVNLRGRVFRSVNGGPEEIFEGTAARTGSKVSPVLYGQTLEFRLRKSTDDSLLASVTVTTDKTTGLPRAVLDVNKDVIAKGQAIFNLKVSPGIDSVKITFRTRQPCSPFIEIVNDVNHKTVVLFKRPELRQFHELDTDAEGWILAQNRPHSYRIVAAASPSSPIPGDSVAKGTFKTGMRSAEVHFDTIHVRNDGDPGLKGAGEFSFRFAAGDAITDEDLSHTTVTYSADIDAGTDEAVNKVVHTGVSPRVLWLSVRGTEDDRSIFDPEAMGLCTIGTVLGGPPGSRGISNGQCAVAQVTDNVDISQVPIGTTTELPFQMSTGDFAIAFDVTGRVLVETKPGEWPQEFVEYKPPQPYTKQSGSNGMITPKKNVTVVRKQTKAQRVMFAPGGELFHQVLGSCPNCENPWTSLGGRFQGPVTVVATGPDRVALFGLSGDGDVVFRTHGPDSNAHGDWQSLGGRFAAHPIAVAHAESNLEVFALDERGMVSHRTLTERGDPRGEWTIIGEEITGPLVALSLPRTGVSLFALGRGGRVLHKRRPPNEDWHPRGRDWESLGDATEGLLSAEWVGETGVLLAVLAPDETVRVLAWQNYPDPPRRGWHVEGTVNSLLQGRIREG